MPAPYDYDDEYEDDENRGDSDLVKNLRKQLKEKERLLREHSEELSSLKSGLRERTVSEVLSSKGVNPKVAKLMPSEVVTPEDIDQWLTDYSDVFNIGRDEPRSAEEAEPSEKSEKMASYDRMRAVEGDGQPSSGTEALQQKIANATNEAELMAILRGGS